MAFRICIILFSSGLLSNYIWATTAYPPERLFPEQHKNYQWLLQNETIDSALNYLSAFSLKIQRSSVDSCILAYEWTLDEADKYKKESTARHCLIALRFLYRISGKFEKGLAAARREINEFLPEGDSAPQAVDGYLGMLFLDWGKFDSAQIYFKQYYLDNKLFGNQRETSRAANNVGLLYSKIGEFELAIKYYSEALDLAEEMRDTLATIYALHNLGGMFLRMQNYSEVEKYLTRVEALCIEADVESILYRTKLLLAEALHKRGENDEAIDVCQKGLKYLSDLKIYPRMVEGYRLLAEIYLTEGKLDSTQKYLDNAKDILSHVDQVDLRIKVNQNLSRLYQALGRQGEALSIMLSVQMEAEANDRAIFLPKIYRWLSEFYQVDGQWKASSAMAHKAIESQARWQSMRQSRLVYEMQTDLDLVQKNQEIAVLQAIQAEQKKQVGLQRKLNIALVAILVGALCFLGFTWSSLRKSKIITQQQRDLHLQQMQMKDQERNLSVVQALVEGQETERKRIASELHDGLGTLLAGIRLQLQSILPGIIQTDDSEAIRLAEQSMGEAYEEVRRISHDMMPGVLSKYGLIDALENLSNQTQDIASTNIEFEVMGDPIKLSDTCNIMIYRIFQELLNNTLKHADASDVFMQLVFDPGAITVMVEDNGKGFDLNKMEGKATVGLQSLESRVKFLSGTLDIDARPNGGTSVVIHFPANFELMDAMRQNKPAVSD